MAEPAYLRPVGGFIVKQRGPAPNGKGRWQEPRWHATLDEAFNEAERVARRMGRSYSILQEVGSVEPEFREVEQPVESATEPDALVALRAVEWSADLDRAGGGHEPGCPYCGEPKRLGHAAHCRVGSAIKSAEGR